MSQPYSTSVPGTSRPPDAAQVLDRFELTWQGGAPPRLEEFVPPLAPSEGPADPARCALLHELVTIDLEYRWRRAAQGIAPAPPRLENYVRRYPELGPTEGVALDLIGYEYRVRHSWGDRPGHDEYAARFPQHGAKLAPWLAGIDAELAVEFAPEASAAGPSADLSPAAVTSVSALIHSLRECRLLLAAQLDEVERQASFPDARGLARELLQRGWLTPFQANQLLQGRGGDLVLGPYVMLERLGAGGGGQVFKARHQKLGRAVALKLIRKELLTDAEVLGRFYREIQVVSQLDHPNVVRAYDAGPVGGTHFLAMELVEGTDLGRLVKQRGPLPVTEACEYIRQAACGLAHAHEKGLVHRDVKPHNLLLSRPDGPQYLGPGTVKVADLGLARILRAANEATAVLVGVQSTGTLTPENAVMIGTADYLAPEQALDFHAADIRADIYSLGCTLYFLLTGRPPFAGGTLAQKVAKHLQGDFPAVQGLRPEVTALLARMVARRPEDRFQSPAEVARALVDLQACGAPRRFGWAGRWRRRGLLAAAAVVLLALSPLLWWLALGMHTPAPEQNEPDALKKFLALMHSPDRTAASLDGELLAFRRNHPELQERLRQELLAVRQRSAGSPQAVRTAGLVMQLPSPLDELDERQVPAAQRFPDLVAVAGAGRSGGVAAVAFSPDGKLAACNGPTPGTLEVWDLTRSAPVKLAERKGHADLVRSLAFAPDGTTLASASLDKTVCLWDVSNGLPERRAVFEGHESSVYALVFTPDGKAVVSGGNDHTVRRWDRATGKAQVLATVPNLVRTMDFAPNGKLLAVAGSYGPWVVTVLNIADPEHFWNFTLKGHTSLSITCVAFAPDGQTLASGAADHTVRLWDVAAQKERPYSPLMGHGPSVSAVAFAPDGQTLASVERVPEGGPAPKDYRLICWDVASGTKRREWTLPRGGARCVTFAIDGRHLAVGGLDGTLYIVRVTPPVSRVVP